MSGSGTGDAAATPAVVAPSAEAVAVDGLSLVRLEHGKMMLLVSPDVDERALGRPVVLCVDTSGSMRTIDPAVLKAAVVRTLRHFASTSTPVTVLAFSHDIRYFKWRSGRRDVLLVASGMVDIHTPRSRMLMGGGAMAPAVMPNNSELFEWVATSIVASIGGATLGTCAIQVAAAVLKANSDARGGNILVLCDGSEYYCRQLYPHHCLPVADAAINAVSGPVTLSALGLGPNANMDWLAALAHEFGGTLSVAHEEGALGGALAEIVRTYTLKGRTVTAPGGSRQSATLGLLAAVDMKGSGGAHVTDFVDVKVQGESKSEQTVTLPVRKASPMELGFIYASKLAKKAYRRVKEGLTSETVEKLLAKIGQREAELTAMLDAKSSLTAKALVLKPLAELRSCLDSAIRAVGDAQATVSTAVAMWRLADRVLLGNVATSADSHVRLMRLRMDEAVMEAKEAFTEEFEAWAEADDSRAERYCCVMSACSDELLGIPVHQHVGDTTRALGALTWAKLWREKDVAMSARLEEDGTVLVGVDSFAALRDNDGTAELDAGTGLTVDMSAAVGSASAAPAAPASAVGAAGAGQGEAGSGAGAGTAMVMASSGKVIKNKYHLERLRAVATKGVRVGWMVATNVVPVITSAEFAANKYVRRQVCEEMAAIQYGDRQFWGKPHLTLQVYGRLVGSMVFSAAHGQFNSSRLPALADLFRTMMLIDHAGVKSFALASVFSRHTLCRHNAPDLWVLGVSAATCTPAEFAGMKPILWFEFVRRAIARSDLSGMFGVGAFSTASKEPRLNPTRFMRLALPYILVANRFVNCLQALVTNQEELLETAPAPADLLEVLGQAFNDDKDPSFGVAPTPGGVAGGDGEDDSAEVAAGGKVEEEAGAGKGEGSAAGAATLGTEATASAAMVEAADPFGRSFDAMLEQVAIAAAIEERKYRASRGNPLDNGVAQARVRSWVLRSPSVLSQSCPELVEEGVEAHELGKRIFKAPISAVMALGRLFARHMSIDERYRVLDALRTLVMGNPYLALNAPFLKRLAKGYSLECSYADSGDGKKLHKTRDAMSTNMRAAFEELPETSQARSALLARRKAARKNIRKYAGAAAEALAVAVPRIEAVLRAHTSSTGGDGKAMLRSKAPSLRKFGRALAFTLRADARAAVEECAGAVAMDEELRAIVGSSLYENEFLGTAIATALSNAGRLVTEEGWLQLATLRTVWD